MQELSHLFLILTTMIIFVEAVKITFPNVDANFPVSCNLTNKVFGICKNIKFCTTALSGINKPNTCYFEGFEEFVCCQPSAVDNSFNFSQRRAVRACEVNYPDVQFIVGGTIAKPREFPYMVALGWESFGINSYDFKCGGALIESNFIITAAHCAYLNGLSPVVALPGGANLTDFSAKTYKIARIIMHPDYNSSTIYNDIALIQTMEPIEERKACLWDRYSLEDNNVTAIGYGHTQFAGPSSSELLKASLVAVSNVECSVYYPSDLKAANGLIEKQLCAKDPEEFRDTCQGDSGGPLIMQQKKSGISRPAVVGITSFGHSCAGKPPGVYTRISAYLDWIENIVWPI